MPANLTPDYLAAERKFREAKTVPEKIVCLEEMLATIPKHKGTDHLQADLKRRLSKLRQEAQTKKKHGERFQPWLIERQGAGQIAIVGPPNSGKSSILAAMTNAHPIVAEYPFSTQLPIPGMMAYEDVQAQLVDTPPISEEFTESWMSEIVRRADAVLLVIDLQTDDLLHHVDMVCSRLEQSRIRVVCELPEESEHGWAHRRSCITATKIDTDGANERLDLLREFIGDGIPVYPVSVLIPETLAELRQALWDLLRVIRVYSKPPGHRPDLTHPYIVPQGTTLIGLAEVVHKDFATNLRYARVWGPDDGAGSARFPGQPVERDHVLADRDIVELHQ